MAERAAPSIVYCPFRKVDGSSDVCIYENCAFWDRKKNRCYIVAFLKYHSRFLDL